MIVAVVQHVDIVKVFETPVSVTVREEDAMRYAVINFSVNKTLDIMEKAGILKLSDLIGKRVEITGYDKESISWKNME